MQKENKLTVGQWCDHWFTANRHKWNSNTEGGYRNLIYSHIIPSIGGVVLSGLTKQTIINFYDSLRSQGLGARSVWCVHLLLRRCMDEAAQDQLIPYNPVRLCQEPKAEEYKTAPLRLGQLQRYLNAAEQLGVLPLIYTGLQQKNFLENVISNADYNFLKKQLKKDCNMEWYFVVWYLAATGARVSELIQIKIEHVELGYFDLYTKGGKLRRL